MARFRDSESVEWTLGLTVGLAAELRSEAALDVGKPDSFGVLYTEPEAVARVLWVMCRKEAEARSITPEQFAHRLDFETIDRAVDALLEAVTDFFHRRRAGAAKPGLRAALRRVDERIEAAIREAIPAETTAATSSNSAGNSPGSSALTPPP